MSDKAGQQTGAALVLVLLGILVFCAIGAFSILSVDRNHDLRFAFQRSIVGFHSAEAGIHRGAVDVQNSMLNFQLPTNCAVAGSYSFNINGRTVTYYLSVPTGAPYNGTAGSCTETPLRITEAAGPYIGLKAQLYTYNLTSKAKNALGFVESSINNQFQAHLIPMFQFTAFYSEDLEFLPGPPALTAGRLHTNKDMYLNTESCGAAPSSGLDLLGRITIAGSGTLQRGRKDDLTNRNNVYISTDGTTGGLQVLGTDAQGSPSCAQVATRQILPAEIATFNNRITTGVQNIQVPTPPGLLCVPWISGCGSTGSYWQSANLRIALDTTQTVPTGAAGPNNKIYAIEILNADGSVNGAATTNLQAFMNANPGAITYTDAPVPASGWNCDTLHGGIATCESTYLDGTQYNHGGNYATDFPKTANGCPADRSPRVQITAANYCGDYRYGGFFSWREHKPVLMLNIDWMAFEEYNNANGDVFFNHADVSNGGAVIFLTVKDTSGTESLAADNYGVRIYDAARARRNSSTTTDPGVTFVTDQAMYVAGNFNCPQPDLSGGGSVRAKCGDAVWPPTGTTTLQKGAALVGDTINVQSCNWIAAPAGSDPCGSFNMDADQWSTACGNGCRPADEASTVQSGSILDSTYVGGARACGGSGCAARETIVKAGFLGNIDATWCSTIPSGKGCGYSYYNGGLENYPRFHEDWGSGTNYWYEGSYVAIGTPRHTCWQYAAQMIAIGNDPNYSCGQYTLQGFWNTQRYNPPSRHWFYDVSFNDSAYLPPLTPRFVYLSLVFFTQVYQ